MRVVMTGPHGIGKSATAIKLNKALPDFLYIPSFAGPVAKRMGFDLNKPHTTQQLIDYQERVLEVFIESYKATAFVDTIYDRSPIDLIGYMLTGVQGSEFEKNDKQVASFVQRCLDATSKYCDILIYPEADLSEPMQNKHNRPVDSKYNREGFDKLLDYYVGKAAKFLRVIDVPVQFQYNDRVNYILDKMGSNVRI